MNEYRAGRFKITHNLLKEWKELLPLFANLVVVGAQPNFLGWTDYTAFSPLFDIIELGEEAPTYEIEVTKQPDGTLTFKANRNT